MALGDHFGLDRALADLEQKIQDATFDELMIGLSGELRRIFLAERVTVYVVDPIRTEIYSRFKDGKEVKEIRVPIGPRSISGFVAAEGRTVRFADVYDDAELAAVHPDLRFDKSWDQRTGFRTKQVLAAPVLGASRVEGVIQLINQRDDRPFGRHHERLLERVAKSLSLAFAGKRLVNLGGSRFHHLIRERLVHEDTLDEARKVAREEKVSPEAVLISRYDVPKDQVLSSLAEFYGVPPIDPAPEDVSLPDDLRELFTPTFLRARMIVPISDDGTVVTLAAANPKKLAFCDEVARLLSHREIEIRVAVLEDILILIDEIYPSAPRAPADGTA